MLSGAVRVLAGLALSGGSGVESVSLSFPASRGPHIPGSWSRPLPYSQRHKSSMTLRICLHCHVSSEVDLAATLQRCCDDPGPPGCSWATFLDTEVPSCVPPS
ncbi:Hypothetical predicted protein [Marmota monax]|uniref:Uncharacterized protein n=1 Tax=Marmota monax TaxID=9995 RepID=A0A5E4A294_MARMO|nr:hypothetical protein GHT09_007576 [Marmota monax]VTJ51337.1 Hypothetical predicted protein [Marmota monax]